ncbi:MAG TPA: hypothetical protein VK123_01080 [Candidatus Limnocylindrales bacterium]|nr:hypothetical protein [Candidatus Limnocylindrales bacterium]
MRRRIRAAAWVAVALLGAASAGAQPADSTAAAAPDTSGFVVRVDAARKRGEASLADLLRGRRPVFVAAVPSFEPVLGVPILPDAGGTIRPGPESISGERATDRTVISSLPTEAGVPALATALDLPESRGLDVFDYVALDSVLAPGPFRSAGELLASPRAVLFTALAMPDPPLPKRVRSALFYRKGDGGLLDTGARFSSPFFGRGVAGSFVRHTADALPPLLKSLSQRYTAAAGLTRGGPFQSWVEARLFTMNMEIDFPGGYDNPFFQVPTHARAEWASREAALHARWEGPGVEATGVLRVGHGQATQVGYQGNRERWRFPEVAAEGSVTGAGWDGWSWSLGGEAGSGRIEYRDDFSTFHPKISSGRLTAGLRRGTGARGAAADVAADVREGDESLVDGRLSWWTAAARGRARLDLESAHERPTFVDLLTPEREITYFPTTFLKSIVFRRAGNPSLRARTLRGALAAASLSVTPRVQAFAYGSLRHVTDDFGWNAHRAESADTVVIEDVAGQRGDGWAALGAAGGEATFGPVGFRGTAWIRGGGKGLSPQSGSPPRGGLDASTGLRASFFQGDLPLELDLEAHATGTRRGLIRAPALVTWDARLRADFGSAGVFLTVTNLFDESVPSAIYQIEEDRGAPLPGRALSAGVIWYLLD